jgi:hypothetical protein
MAEKETLATAQATQATASMQTQSSAQLPTRRLKITFERSLIMITTSIALTSAIASVISTWLSARQLEAGYESIRINARNTRFEQLFTAGNQFCMTITPLYIRERYFARVRENTMADGQKRLASMVVQYDLSEPADEKMIRKAMEANGASIDAAFLSINYQKKMLELWSDIDLEPLMTDLMTYQIEAIGLSPDYAPGKDVLLDANGKLSGNNVAKFYAEKEFRCRQTMDSAHQAFIAHHLKTAAQPAAPRYDTDKAPHDKP